MAYVADEDPRLERMAELLVSTALNIAPGQELIVTASVEALPLVRRVAAAAYRAGAALVTPLLGDPSITLSRFRHGQADGFDRAPAWLYEGMARAFDNNAARLAIMCDDPQLLADEDPECVSRATRANAEAYRPAAERISGFAVNWTVAAYPGRDWARRVFPDAGPDEAQRRLADAIFAASRVDGDDPAAAWHAHGARLAERTGWLNGQRFAALHFRGPGTDLRVGLAEDHLWLGGGVTARNGVACFPNVPTEEVFTTPHAQRVDGVVRASKPLAYQGSVIDGIEMRFQDGKAVAASARHGQEALTRMLDSDAGARHLGEVALVPASSPISQSDILFFNTLFDENAACHIALGRAYAEAIRGGGALSREALAAKGANDSIIHVDWMIGNAETEVDGIAADGTVIPVFRAGEWA